MSNYPSQQQQETGGANKRQSRHSSAGPVHLRSSSDQLVPVKPPNRIQEQVASNTDRRAAAIRQQNRNSVFQVTQTLSQ